MSSRSRIQGAIAALALAALALPVSVPAALADPTDSTPTTIEMGLDGAQAKPVSTVIPVTAPSVVPGDSKTTKITVVNQGPSTATMTVDIVDVTLAEPVDEGFYDDLRINGWSPRELADAPANPAWGTAPGETQIISETEIGKGASDTFALAYAFPWGSTSGNTVAPDDAKVTFKLRVTLRADWCPEGMVNGANGECVMVDNPVSISCPTGTALDAAGNCVKKDGSDPGTDPNGGGNKNGNGNGGSGNGGNGGNGASDPILPTTFADAASRLGQGIRSAMPKTGAEIAGAGAIAGGLLATGIWFLIAAKRRRKDEDEYEEAAEAAVTAETIDSAEEAQR